jgi:hypothetical protein
VTAAITPVCAPLQYPVICQDQHITISYGSAVFGTAETTCLQ